MKKFTTLQEALAYQSICPICQDKLAFDADQEVKSCHSGFDEKTIIFRSGNSTITIDYDSGYIKKYSETRSINKIYDISSKTPISFYPGPHQPFSSIFSASVKCYNCCQYSYLLQIHTSKEKITEFYLNAEFISLEDSNNTIYELKNNYFTKITQYTSFKTNPSIGVEDSKTISLPLIMWNLTAPQKTLDKIKTLIIFS